MILIKGGRPVIGSCCAVAGSGGANLAGCLGLAFKTSPEGAPISRRAWALSRGGVAADALWRIPSGERAKAVQLSCRTLTLRRVRHGLIEGDRPTLVPRCNKQLLGQRLAGRQLGIVGERQLRRRCGFRP